MDVGLPDPDLPPDEEPLAGHPPLELEAPPELGQLLRELSCVLGSQGLSRDLERGLRQAEAELGRQRGIWLRWESLWRGLQELLRDPHGLEPPVIQGLERALVSSELRHGPPAFASLLPPPEDPSALGARLLPELERRLAEKVEELGSYHRGGGTPPDPRSPPEEVAEGLAAERRRLGRARDRQRHLVRLLEQQHRAYRQVLGRCRALLGRAQGLGPAQAELDEHQTEYLEAKGAATLLKTRLEELTVLLDTYPPEKVEAHRRIRAGLEEARREAELEAEQARARAGAYKGLGPAFEALASEYGRLREQLGHRRWALGRLRAQQHPDGGVTSP